MFCGSKHWPSTSLPKFFTLSTFKVLVDSKQLFTNVVSQWPGSVHDSRILRHSALYRLYESGQGEGIILGHSGCPCRVWLMTPRNRHEHAFNMAHIQTRVKVKQTIGTLKRTMRCASLRTKCSMYNLIANVNTFNIVSIFSFPNYLNLTFTHDEIPIMSLHPANARKNVGPRRKQQSMKKE